MKQPGPEKIIKESRYNEKLWEEWERKGGWRPEGWKIVEMNDGPTLNDLKPEKFLVVHRPHGSMFHHSYGKVSQFFTGLLEGELYGTKCPTCGLVYCPPRAHCFNPKCRLEETKWVELAKKGEVHSYTIMVIAWPSMAHLQPLVGAMVRIDGTNTCLPMTMRDIDPEKAILRCEGKDSFEDMKFLFKIRKRYLELADKEDFIVVNANNGLNKVHEDIKRVIARKLGMCI